MNYLDKEIEKLIKKMKYHFKNNKTYDWKRIRNYLYELKDKAFEEGKKVSASKQITSEEEE